ncbi:MAG: hypothetical protein Q9170_002985 [Blastenia crenularia]
MENQGWDKSKVNTVNRYRGRDPFRKGKYDFQTVHTIVDETPILHVSFPASAEDDNPFPTILPMLGCTSSYPDALRDDKSESRIVYLHGSASARMMRLTKSADGADGSAPTSDNNENGKGTPVCIAATQFDGVVLALTPFNHSCNYRSTVLFGHAHIVTDDAERLHAMGLITNNLVPARWENSRVPPTKTELTATGILRVEIESASAKVRAGTTGEDRKDLKDEEMRGRVWNGVVPAYMQWGAPQAAPTNLTKGVPGYLEEWVEKDNKKNERFAYDVAKG